MADELDSIRDAEGRGQISYRKFVAAAASRERRTNHPEMSVRLVLQKQCKRANQNIQPLYAANDADKQDEPRDALLKTGRDKRALVKNIRQQLDTHRVAHHFAHRPAGGFAYGSDNTNYGQRIDDLCSRPPLIVEPRDPVRVFGDYDGDTEFAPDFRGDHAFGINEVGVDEMEWPFRMKLACKFLNDG